VRICSWTFPAAAPGGSDLSGLAVDLDGERDKEFFAASAAALGLDFVYGDRRREDPTAQY